MWLRSVDSRYVFAGGRLQVKEATEHLTSSSESVTDDDETTFYSPVTLEAATKTEKRKFVAATGAPIRSKLVVLRYKYPGRVIPSVYNFG